MITTNLKNDFVLIMLWLYSSSKSVSPREKLVHMNKAEELKERRTQEEKENLRQWMTEKFRQRHDNYMEKRKGLIEREPRPYKTQASVSPDLFIIFIF